MLMKGRNVELAVELRTALDMLREERSRAAELARSWEEREAALRGAELSADLTRRAWLRRAWRLAAGGGCLQERLLDVETLARAEAEKMRESLAALQSPPRAYCPYHRDIASSKDHPPAAKAVACPRAHRLGQFLDSRPREGRRPAGRHGGCGSRDLPRAIRARWDGRRGGARGERGVCL